MIFFSIRSLFIRISGSKSFLATYCSYQCCVIEDLLLWNSFEKVLIAWVTRSACALTDAIFSAALELCCTLRGDTETWLLVLLYEVK